MADSFGYTEATLAERKVANSLGLGVLYTIKQILMDGPYWVSVGKPVV